MKELKLLTTNFPDSSLIDVPEDHKVLLPLEYLKKITKYVEATSAAILSMGADREDLLPSYVCGTPKIQEISSEHWKDIQKGATHGKAFAIDYVSKIFISTFQDDNVQIPAALIFEFSDINKIDKWHCIAVANEMWALIKSTELDRRAKCISEINNAQKSFPDEIQTLETVNKALRTYFGAGIVSLSLILEKNEKWIKFRRHFIESNKAEVEEYVAHSGFNYEAVNFNSPIIVSNLEIQNGLGKALHYPNSIITKANARKSSIKYITTEKSTSEEKSLMFVPLFDRKGTKVIAVAKVGDFNSHNVYDEFNMRAFVELSRSVSLLLNSLQLSQAANSLGIEIESAAHLENIMENFLAYKEISLGLFHQVSHKVHDMALSLENSKIEFEFKKTINFTEFQLFYNDVKADISTVKKLISKAQRLGSSKVQSFKECFIVEDVLNELIVYALELSASTSESKEIKVEKTFGNEDYLVVVDPDYLLEALINIVNNAAWAVRKDSRLGKGNRRLAIRLLCQNNEKIKLIFEDNGVGMSREIQKKVFDPQFTTKKNGTGYGLFFARKIIEESSGKLSIDRSFEGEGTKFSVELPFIASQYRL